MLLTWPYALKNAVFTLGTILRMRASAQIFSLGYITQKYVCMCVLWIGKHQTSSSQYYSQNQGKCPGIFFKIYYLQKFKKERDWQTLDFLFQAPITPMLLYECKIWGPSITENTWNELKGCRYWKQLATTFLRIKVSTLYEILLA